MVGRQVGRRCSTARSSRVETDAGLVGHGEVCPLGPFYLPAYAEGVRAGLAELGAAPDRRRPARARQAQPPDGRGARRATPTSSRASTSPAGTSSARPRGCRSATLLGGRYGEDFVLYRAISQESPEAMAGEVAGYRARGLPPVPAQGRRRSRRRHRAHPRRARAMLAAGGRAHRRRQHRLAAARGDARRARGARRRRLHRAAVR